MTTRHCPANQIDASLKRYAEDYQSYLERHANRMPFRSDPIRALSELVVFPGMGVLCAGLRRRSGRNRPRYHEPRRWPPRV
ncbi:MAG: hypothetical protein Ct9H300mP14_04580 [Gammaproteobacteria bacterium]|nr:MAG: hypothetical protein Ct9H300mP14_04580 [Gammaproteobacteria bacterium]